MPEAAAPRDPAVATQATFETRSHKAGACSRPPSPTANTRPGQAWWPPRRPCAQLKALPRSSKGSCPGREPSRLSLPVGGRDGRTVTASCSPAPSLCSRGRLEEAPHKSSKDRLLKSIKTGPNSSSHWSNPASSPFSPRSAKVTVSMIGAEQPKQQPQVTATPKHCTKHALPFTAGRTKG